MRPAVDRDGSMSRAGRAAALEHASQLIADVVEGCKRRRQQFGAAGLVLFVFAQSRMSRYAQHANQHRLIGRRRMR